MQPFSDEDASIETLSHCSSCSDSTSVADEGEIDPLPFGNACSVFLDANPVALLRRQVEKPARTRPRRTSSTS